MNAITEILENSRNCFKNTLKVHCLRHVYTVRTTGAKNRNQNESINVFYDYSLGKSINGTGHNALAVLYMIL